MFNDRQLLGLELSCRAIAQEQDERIRNALITNLSDLLRYQNMLCRYDTMALKSLDIFSVHGFPIGLVQCESNLLGIANGGGMSVGSGGWSNIMEKYLKAKTYCDHPFETRHEGTRKIQVPIMVNGLATEKTATRQRIQGMSAFSARAQRPRICRRQVLTAFLPTHLTSAMSSTPN